MFIPILATIAPIAVLSSRMNAEHARATMLGGDKALGSSGERCCCPKPSEQTSKPNVSVCLDPDTMTAYTMSHERWELPKKETFYESVADFAFSGRKCRKFGEKDRGFLEKKTFKDKKSVNELGKAALVNSASQANSQKRIKFYDAWFSPSKDQMYTECVDTVWQRSYTKKGFIRGTPASCENIGLCKEERQFSYCGFANHNTGLIRYTKVGVVGKCIPDAKLRKKLFVNYKVCPSGHYHGTHGGQQCDCNDACP